MVWTTDDGTSINGLFLSNISLGKNLSHRTKNLIILSSMINNLDIPYHYNNIDEDFFQIPLRLFDQAMDRL